MPLLFNSSNPIDSHIQHELNLMQKHANPIVQEASGSLLVPIINFVTQLEQGQERAYFFEDLKAQLVSASQHTDDRTDMLITAKQVFDTLIRSDKYNHILTHADEAKSSMDTSRTR